jgi:hypothetical protein
MDSKRLENAWAWKMGCLFTPIAGMLKNHII